MADIIGFVAEYGGWSWIVAGAVLLAIELIVPGGVFVWLGMSAIVVGLATLVQAIGWQWQWALFGVLSIVSVAGWTMYSRRRPAESDSPFLNRRTGRFVGQVHALGEPIENGEEPGQDRGRRWLGAEGRIGRLAGYGVRLAGTGGSSYITRIEMRSFEAT